MFERFTQQARRVVVLAQEEARNLNHNYIGTEHILLAILHDQGDAAEALQSLGVTEVAVRQQVEEIVGRGRKEPSGHMPFTPLAKKTLELSLPEAITLGHTYIGPGHLLLGLVRVGEGPAAQALAALDADPDRIRQEMIQRMAAGREGGEPGPSQDGKA